MPTNSYPVLSLSFLALFTPFFADANTVNPAEQLPAILGYQAQSPEPPANVQTSLISAVGVGTASEVVQWLQQKGNPNGLDNRQIPLLALAAMRKDESAAGIMQALLDAGAEVNVRDQYQQTPLIYATRKSLLENVQFLIAHGADPQLADRSGATALDYAKSANRQDIVAALGKTSLSQPSAPTARPTPAATPLAQPLNRPQLLQTIRNLSYHSCGAAYWRYASRVNLETDLGPGKAVVAANVQEQMVEQDTQALRQRFQASDDYIATIVTHSQNDIVDQISAFATNAQRTGEGIGTKDDMVKRCGAISESWSFSAGGLKKKGATPTTVTPGVTPQQAYDPKGAIQPQNAYKAPAPIDKDAMGYKAPEPMDEDAVGYKPPSPVELKPAQIPPAQGLE